MFQSKYTTDSKTQQSKADSSSIWCNVRNMNLYELHWFYFCILLLYKNILLMIIWAKKKSVETSVVRIAGIGYQFWLVGLFACLFLLLVATGDVHVNQSDRENCQHCSSTHCPPPWSKTLSLSICRNSALIEDSQSQLLRINNVAKDCMRGLESLTHPPDIPNLFYLSLNRNLPVISRIKITPGPYSKD